MNQGQMIKQYIDSIGMKQTFLSKKTGITLTKLNASLNGKRRLSFEEYELLCGALNVNTDRFLTPRTTK